MEIKELKKFLKNSYGYITTKEIESIGISKALIPELINQKILRKVAYGIYIDNNLIEDEFYILQKRFSNIVFSYNTACYLMNLSDRAPYKIDVTTINHNNINENLNIYYVSKEKFNTMTASWVGIGFLLNKAVAFIFIRPERYTYEFIEKNDMLTLSFLGSGNSSI